MEWEVREEVMDSLEQAREAIDGLVGRVDAQTLWMSGGIALALVLLLLLLLVTQRLRRRNRKVEVWLEGEMKRIHETLEQAQRGQQRLLSALDSLSPARQEAGYRPSPIYPSPMMAGDPGSSGASGAGKRPENATDRPGSGEPISVEALTALVNNLLAGKQPYNIVEALHVMNPHLNLQRMTPRAQADEWAQQVLLDPGGDGLFACVEQDRAQLYPNYSRFSATLDPRPLYENARHGARIHAVQRPASLVKSEGGGWRLTEKGAVVMR